MSTYSIVGSITATDTIWAKKSAQYDPLFSNVVLLCNFNRSDVDGSGNGAIYDSAKNNNLALKYPCNTSSTDSKYGAASLTLLGGSVTGDHNPANNIDGLTDFCIEFWAMPMASANVKIARCGNTANINWQVSIQNNKVVFSWGSSITCTQYMIYSPTITWPVGGVWAWHFIKCSFTGSLAKILVDGTLQASATIDNVIQPRLSGPSDFITLDDFGSTQFCRLDELRVTIGDSRAAFDAVVPTKSFPTGSERAFIGKITASNTPSNVANNTFIRTIIGNVITLDQPNAQLAKGYWRYNLIGSINTSCQPVAIMTKGFYRSIAGFIATRSLPAANLSKLFIVPINWISRQFLCVLTGLPDLILPVFSINISLTASGTSTLSLVVHGDNQNLLNIQTRSSGTIVIKRRYVYNGGSVIDREFIRMPLDTITSDQGPVAGTTVTLQGRATLLATSSKPVTLFGASYRNFSSGQLRYRCSVDDNVALGDVAAINGESMVVGGITYAISPSDEFMEITEYQANGIDLSAAIGSNARPLTLSAYVVNSDNLHYSLWRTNGFFYNGIADSTPNAVASYTLYSDSAGLLWYLPGSEGNTNIAVLLSDGITQAAINVL